MKKNHVRHSWWKYPKLLVITLTVCLCFAEPYKGWSQQPSKSEQYLQARVSLNLTDVTLKKALSALQKSTPFRFLYNSQLIDDSRKVSIVATNEPVKDVLNKLFSGIGIQFKIMDRQVILSPKDASWNAPVAENDKSGAIADSRSGDERRAIKGRIVDEAGSPIPGVTVMVKGTAIGTSTNIDGYYSLKIPEGHTSITASFIGYSPVNISINGNDTYNIVMIAKASQMDEVVVTGYQTLSKERATGAFNTVRAEQLDKPASNISQRLIGSAAGVQATTDPNGKVTFQIRGLTSLTADAQPLVVVDGFPVEGGLETLNPNDVESMTILKDAAAASIWGARSANGVIVVTLKAASKKTCKTTVLASSFVKVAPKFDLGYALPNASSSQIVDYIIAGFKMPETVNTIDANTALAGSLNNAVYIALNENRLGYLSTEELNKKLDFYRSYNNSGQIKKYLMQMPVTQQYNVSILNSSERSSNAVSLMFENSKLALKGNDNEKFMANVKSSTALYKWLDVNFAGNFWINDENSNGSLPALYPFDMLVDSNGGRVPVYNELYLPNINRYVPSKLFPYQDWTYNPVTDMEARDYRTRTKNYRVQLGFTFKPISGLTFESKAQFERNEKEKRNLLSDKAYAVRYFVNSYSYWNKTANTVTSNVPKGSWLDLSGGTITTLNWRNQVNFDKTFAEVHSVNVVGGFELQSRLADETINPRVYGYNGKMLTVGSFPNGLGTSANPLYGWFGYTMPNIPYASSFKSFSDRYVSAYVNASYTYSSKYTISASARTDASNLITDKPEARYSPFWSVGGIWQISKESFMANLTFIDRLALRATYGFNGNVDKSTSPIPLLDIGSSQNYYKDDYTASIASFGNPDLTWEKTGNLNIGIDYSLMDGKLFGKVDLYNKKGDNLLVSTSIPSANGTSTQKLNLAQMVNRGVEVEIGTRLKVADNIVWNGFFNFSYNHNEITKLFKSSYTHSDLYSRDRTRVYLEGQNANSLWALRYGGMMNTGTATSPVMYPSVLDKNGVQYPISTWLPGDIRDYWQNEGTTVAPYTIGFTNQFSVYDFQVSFIITGKMGHVFNGFQFNYPSLNGRGTASIPNELWGEAAASDGSTMVPYPSKYESRYNFWNRFYSNIDYRVQNATHFRFQEMNVTYRVPKQLLSRIGIAAASIYAQGNNLYTLTFNKYNEDPEYPKGNIKPVPTYTFGLNLTF